MRTSALTIALCPAIAQAQAQTDDATSSHEVEPTSDDLHDAIVVTAAGLDRLDMLAGTSVLDGTALTRNMAGQVGDMLADIPGVSATGFAPGVSRPVLRGFGGERVRVLSDGVGAIDASSTSDDHAVTVDPLIAERIEVLRGPAVLLYGSQAIGGAVNVITKRIPPRVPDEPVHLDAIASLDSAANLREGGVSLDAPLGSSVAFHVDASHRQSGDLEIPGYAASDKLRAQMFAAADEEEEEGHLDEAAELREGANVSGKLPNSWTDTTSVGTGLAFFSGESDIGVSFDYYDTSYGIPGLPGVGHVHEHEEGADEEGPAEEEGPVSIGMKRYRLGLRGTLDLGDGFFDNLQTRWTWADYTHTEFEGEETGTVFDVQGIEGRMELVQSRRGAWQGSLGAQYGKTDFAATGAEAFVPSNSTENIALFALQEFDFDPLELELGGRYEHIDVKAMDSIGVTRGFDTFSGAVGLSYALAGGIDDLRIGVNLSRAERAPSAQELFADGPHVATQQYEIGNPALGTEGSWGVEGYMRGALGPAQLSASIYRNWFDGFIYLGDTGTQEDGLEAFAFGQQDASQFGLEGQVKLPLFEAGAVAVDGELNAEYVRATLADGSPVPRIPPFSLLGALEARTGHFDARVEAHWYAAQDRVSLHEEPTDGFTMVGASLAWHPLEGSENLTIIAQVDNLFDVEGRRHASFTKEFVPLAGRNFKLTARVSL